MAPEEAGVLLGCELSVRPAMARASGRDRGNSKRGGLLVKRGVRHPDERQEVWLLRSGTIFQVSLASD
jgi:hypothetical protein